MRELHGLLHQRRIIVNTIDQPPFERFLGRREVVMLLELDEVRPRPVCDQLAIEPQAFLDLLQEVFPGFVLFFLQGNPQVTAIKYQGNKKFKDSKLQKKVTSKVGEPLNERKASAQERRIAPASVENPTVSPRRRKAVGAAAARREYMAEPVRSAAVWSVRTAASGT